MEAPFRLPEFRGVARPLPLDRNNTCRGQHSARQSQAKTYTAYYSLQTHLARVIREICWLKQTTMPHQHRFHQSQAKHVQTTILIYYEHSLHDSQAKSVGYNSLLCTGFTSLERSLFHHLPCPMNTSSASQKRYLYNSLICHINTCFASQKRYRYTTAYHAISTLVLPVKSDTYTTAYHAL